MVSSSLDNRAGRPIFRRRRDSAIGLTPLALAACGGASGGGVDTIGLVEDEGLPTDFPSGYLPPQSSYEAPSEGAPYFEVLKSPYVEPYWVAALQMDGAEATLAPIMEQSGSVVFYSFPDAEPSYDLMDINGWAPANEATREATREIMGRLDDVLGVSFIEVDEPAAMNVVAVAMSTQSGTSGFSYFPNPDFEIGWDVFISKTFANPKQITARLTNYDYEVLVHEIGHALGLKHPFEGQGENTATLPSFDDQTRFTAMSYDDSLTTFDGTMRALDWMALTKFYGVNPLYNDEDDTYNFSNTAGTFIVDGGGVDTIDVNRSSLDAVIDLRPGSHSHLGPQAAHITLARQLTISHGTEIENVITGAGDDTVIGTDTSNVITTGGGGDIIFAGGGADVVRSGPGADRVDLSEATQSVDVVVLDALTSDAEFDVIYGFVQGALGDVLDISQWGAVGAKLFPLVVTGAAPSANFGGGILRLVGDALSTSQGLSSALAGGGELEPLTLSSGSHSIIITSASQGTGEDQCVYSAEGLAGGGVGVSQLALLKGNALDIDQWHADNFSVIA